LRLSDERWQSGEVPMPEVRQREQKVSHLLLSGWFALLPDGSGY
jgi:hypothetical protein